MLHPEWTSNDQTMGAFYDRLEECFSGRAPVAFESFRSHCEDRERTGRDKFGHSSLGKDNVAEAREEAADLSNYMAFDILKYLRATGTEDDSDLALTAAFHAFKAYEATLALEHKRAGAP